MVYSLLFWHKINFNAHTKMFNRQCALSRCNDRIKWNTEGKEIDESSCIHDYPCSCKDLTLFYVFKVRVWTTVANLTNNAKFQWKIPCAENSDACVEVMERQFYLPMVLWNVTVSIYYTLFFLKQKPECYVVSVLWDYDLDGSIVL